MNLQKLIDKLKTACDPIVSGNIQNIKLKERTYPINTKGGSYREFMLTVTEEPITVMLHFFVDVSDEIIKVTSCGLTVMQDQKDSSSLCIIYNQVLEMDLSANSFEFYYDQFINKISEYIKNN